MDILNWKKNIEIRTYKYLLAAGKHFKFTNFNPLTVRLPPPLLLFALYLNNLEAKPSLPFLTFQIFCCRCPHEKKNQ